MFNKIIIISLFIVQMTLCAESYQEYVNEIECAFAKRMQNELNLHWAGTAGTMQDKIVEMGMKFTSKRRISIEEARALELYVIDQFVQAINAHEKIQPFLDISPFTYKRVSILITFDKEDNRRIADGHVCYLSSISDLATTDLKNHIIYCSYDPFKTSFIDLLEEPYEVAVQLNANAPIDLKTHQPNAYAEEMDLLFASFTKEMAKEYALGHRAIGGDLTEGIKTIGATFKLHQPITLEEARQLLITVSEKLLDKVNSNEKIRPYLEKYPFPSESLRIALSFEKNRLYSYPNERIASAELENNTIQYVKQILLPCDDDCPMSRNIDLEPETYEEALKIIQEKPVNFIPKSPSAWIYLREWFGYFMYYSYFFIAPFLR